MNLVNGRILEASDCDTILDMLSDRLSATLVRPLPDPDAVIAACDRLVNNLDEALYLQAMTALGISEARGREYIAEARRMFSGDSLHYRMAKELGAGFGKAQRFVPPGSDDAVTERLYPLGVLLHIAAGNADGLPAFSVLEGLLTGNINILKLPAAEGGISVRLLLELIREEPSLADYIYVFDYSSKDIVHLGKLISVADAVVVWGGVEAVTALRRIVPPNVKLIEWGHKVSFAYVTAAGIQQTGLEGLARNIAETGQLLCSSIQGIYVDGTMDDVHSFCTRFLPVLETAVLDAGPDYGIGLRSQITLKLMSEELEAIFSGSRVYRGAACSLTASPDSTLDTSIQFGNAWVKPLRRDGLLPALRPYKNFLQTVGLVCAPEERQSLAESLLRAGAVRVCPGELMSQGYPGEPHDGDYPLRRYTKTVTIQ